MLQQIQDDPTRKCCDEKFQQNDFEHTRTSHYISKRDTSITRFIHRTNQKESIQTTAALTMEKLEAGFTVTQIHLDVTAKIPGGSPEKFNAAADAAKAGCPISRLLNTKITMEAKLEV